MIATGEDFLSKQTRKEIKVGLKSGQSKQDMFASFRTDENENHLRRFLAKFPDKQPSTIYKVLNVIVYVIWAIFALAEFAGLFDNLSIKTIVSFLITLFITIELIKLNGNVYLPGIIYFLWALIELYVELLRMIRTGEIDEEGSVAAAFIGFSLVVITIILMVIIRKKVFGYYNWFFPYKDEKGQYVFEDLTKS